MAATYQWKSMGKRGKRCVKKCSCCGRFVFAKSSACGGKRKSKKRKK